jgi:hypothetical protein
MALTYADKLKYSNIIRDKFNEIRILKNDLIAALIIDSKVDYDYTVNIIFSKISVIESNIVNLKKEFFGEES